MVILQIIVFAVLLLGSFGLYLKLLGFVEGNDTDSFSDKWLKRLVRVIITVAYFGLAMLIINVLGQ